MKINIENDNVTKEFYDEFLAIANNCKKINKKPNKKIRLLTKDSIICLIIAILLAIYTLVLIIVNGQFIPPSYNRQYQYAKVEFIIQ